MRSFSKMLRKQRKRGKDGVSARSRSSQTSYPSGAQVLHTHDQNRPPLLEENCRYRQRKLRPIRLLSLRRRIPLWNISASLHGYQFLVRYRHRCRLSPSIHLHIKLDDGFEQGLRRAKRLRARHVRDRANHNRRMHGNCYCVIHVDDVQEKRLSYPVPRLSVSLLRGVSIWIAALSRTFP